jgi:heat-inducible transcriptional repressor
MESTPKLNEREQKILQAVINSYITAAEPVGSRSVAKRFDLGLSPATVRNVMADLEEMGYLEQRHSSSGRVPTGRGYRYYVDYLMRVQKLTLDERARMEQEFTEKLNDADDVLRQASHMLALVTNQAGIVESPNEMQAEVQRIDLIPVNTDRMAVLVVDNFGRVRTMTVHLEERMPTDVIPKLTQFLNEHLHGVKVEEMVTAMEQKLRSFLDEQRQLAEQAMRLLGLIPTRRASNLFLDGATQLFEQPEFKDVDKAQEIFGLLDEQERVVELLRVAVSEHETESGSILIGLEGKGSLEDISIVASPYEVHGEKVGLVGVLGPRRMPYSRLTSIVHHTAGMVGRLLTRLGT